MKGRSSLLTVGSYAAPVSSSNQAENLLWKSLQTLRRNIGHHPKYARCEIITFALIGKYTGTFYGIEKLWKFEWRD